MIQLRSSRKTSLDARSFQNLLACEGCLRVALVVLEAFLQALQPLVCAGIYQKTCSFLDGELVFLCVEGASIVMDEQGGLQYRALETRRCQGPECVVPKRVARFRYWYKSYVQRVQQIQHSEAAGLLVTDLHFSSVFGSRGKSATLAKWRTGLGLHFRV